VTRRFVPGESISHLARDPLGDRIVRHPDAHQSPPGVAKNDQALDQPKNIVQTTNKSMDPLGVQPFNARMSVGPDLKWVIEVNDLG
jgi:hypothetical protein